MSMKSRRLDAVPETTSRIAHRAFPKGTLAMILQKTERESPGH
ncbi:hypothetical protein Krac_5604 [Ktedonobacter racemifer DSM 44963]|uniref:Uncharacterized protein n=1 Tax=Ktedonobacter racemifer DSM 44963 TaxID=485913 RepID=D6TWF2_KTERA|nr:hypothetical protein Krac_5604 [Ktedonobacter racemifer DSM 44963]